MITDRTIEQAYADLRSICGGVRQDYFGLLFLEREHGLPREKARNHVAFGGNDYGVDGYLFDELRRNLYIFQFKYTNAHSQFKSSLQRLIDSGVERIFSAPNVDDAKNQILLQLRACIHENRALIQQVFFRFVFTGDPEEAERSQVLDHLRERLEDKKYLIDGFFRREVGVVVDFRSASGRVGAFSAPQHSAIYALSINNLVDMEGPTGQRMHIGLVRLADLQRMHKILGSRFFDRNIRYGLGEGEAVNRAISRSLKTIVLDRMEDPRVFAFNHNGITLHAERVEYADGQCRLTAPRLLNGAQTITTTTEFLEAQKGNPALIANAAAFEDIRVLCRIITMADQQFVTRVTINNNRQNPVEPWNLHANDMIQLELQDKFREDLGLYYERQENAFQQLSPDYLEEQGITQDSKAVQMLRLTQTFLLTDGNINRLSEMRRIFEDDRIYDQIFRRSRLTADSRHILLCYKVQFRLRKLTYEIEQKGQNKYAFIHRSRYLLWALTCQGLLNHKNVDSFSKDYGTSMTVPADYTSLLIQISTNKVRLLLSALMSEAAYHDKVEEGNFSFLRTDAAFEKCMKVAYDKWNWTHKKLQGAA